MTDCEWYDANTKRRDSCDNRATMSVTLNDGTYGEQKLCDEHTGEWIAKNPLGGNLFWIVQRV